MDFDRLNYNNHVSSVCRRAVVSVQQLWKSWIYEVCRARIQPFWISREPVTWPWCNLIASQRRPYCACMNSHSLVRLVSRQWGATERACVLWLSHFTMTEQVDQRICIKFCFTLGCSSAEIIQMIKKVFRDD